MITNLIFPGSENGIKDCVYIDKIEESIDKIEESTSVITLSNSL